MTSHKGYLRRVKEGREPHGHLCQTCRTSFLCSRLNQFVCKREFNVSRCKYCASYTAEEREKNRQEHYALRTP
jgi:hypothetical protein